MTIPWPQVSAARPGKIACVFTPQTPLPKRPSRLTEKQLIILDLAILTKPCDDNDGDQ